MKEFTEEELKEYYSDTEEFLNTHLNLKTNVGKYRVSTVELQSHPINQKYETMIFCDDDDNIFEDYQVRYPTEEKAKEGHQKAINYVKDHLKKDN